MKSKLGISKQLFIALTIVNLSVTLFSVVLGYVIYNYAIEKGWISLSSFQQEDWTSFHFVDWIWLATVIFCGCIISLVIGMRLAKRFIVPINFLAEAAKKISHGDLSARAYDNRIHSAEMSELLYNFMIWLKS